MLMILYIIFTCKNSPVFMPVNSIEFYSCHQSLFSAMRYQLQLTSWLISGKVNGSGEVQEVLNLPIQSIEFWLKYWKWTIIIIIIIIINAILCKELDVTQGVIWLPLFFIGCTCKQEAVHNMFGLTMKCLHHGVETYLWEVIGSESIGWWLGEKIDARVWKWEKERCKGVHSLLGYSEWVLKSWLWQCYDGGDSLGCASLMMLCIHSGVALILRQ